VTKTARVALGCLAAAVVAGVAATRADSSPAAEPRWAPQTLQRLATLPVQDRGRVKPLDTLAGFTLLKLNGKRTLELSDGRKLRPLEWLLDVLFFPELAQDYPAFRVQNDEVLTAIGVRAKRKRAWYSYQDLTPGFGRIDELARQFARKQAAEREPVERQLLELYENLVEFDGLLRFLDFARHELPVGEHAAVAAVFPGRPSVRLSDVLGQLPRLRPLLGPQAEADVRAAAQRVADGALHASGRSTALALFPPAEPDPEVGQPLSWLTPADLAQSCMAGRIGPGAQTELLAGLEGLVAAAADPGAFQRRADAFHAELSEQAGARDQYRGVPLEVFFYRADFFYRALGLFLAAFVAIAAGWLLPTHRWPTWSAWGLLIPANLLLVAGIALRCVIRGRPPVTTLYETILFVTAAATLTALFLEWLDRSRVALALGSVIGAAGLFLAGSYEFREATTAGDTMEVMRAVLDTNFWLATHVTTITLGYSAGLLASAIAHVWLGAKLLGARAGDAAFYRRLASMTYGVLCFSLIFSVVGTILGGIWANDSWGRFWGWDPKENGALMICLWQLAIIHARLGGYVRAYGLCALTVLGGLVITFSWWGVNLLGVGLHSYGFTDGVQQALLVFNLGELVFLGATGVWWLAVRPAAPASA